MSGQAIPELAMLGFVPHPNLRIGVAGALLSGVARMERMRNPGCFQDGPEKPVFSESHFTSVHSKCGRPAGRRQAAAVEVAEVRRPMHARCGVGSGKCQKAGAGVDTRPSADRPPQSSVVSNGFRSGTAKCAKSSTLRVTTVSWWTMAVAAIMASS